MISFKATGFRLAALVLVLLVDGISLKSTGTLTACRACDFCGSVPCCLHVSEGSWDCLAGSNWCDEWGGRCTSGTSQLFALEEPKE